PKPGMLSSNSIWSSLPTGSLNLATLACVNFIDVPVREDSGKFSVVFPCIPESNLAPLDQRVQRQLCSNPALLSARVFPSSFGPSDYESGRQEFESLRARHLVLICEHPASRFRLAMTALSSTSLLPLIRIWLSSTSMTSISERM